MAWFSPLWVRESWRAFLRQRAVLVPVTLSLVLCAATWLLVVSFQGARDQSLALRYSIYFGTNWLTEPWVFILVPAISTLVVLIDLVMAYVWGRGSVVLKYLWLWAAVGVATGFLWLAWLLVGFNG